MTFFFSCSLQDLVGMCNEPADASDHFKLKVRGFSGPFYNSNNFFTLSMPALESTCWPSHPLLLVLFIVLIKRIRVADCVIKRIRVADCVNKL